MQALEDIKRSVSPGSRKNASSKTHLTRRRHVPRLEGDAQTKLRARTGQGNAGKNSMPPGKTKSPRHLRPVPQGAARRNSRRRTTG